MRGAGHRRRSLAWPHRASVGATPLASGPTAVRFQAGPPGLRGAARCNCGVSRGRLPVLGKILFESILSISTSTGTQKVIKILFLNTFLKKYLKYFCKSKYCPSN